MARLESEGFSVELKFFVHHDGLLYRTPVFLRLGIGESAFPHPDHCRQSIEDLHGQWTLDLTEWWYSWDSSGSAYVSWIDRALVWKISRLEPDEPWHFGQIVPHEWMAHYPPAERTYSLTIGIDSYNLVGTATNGMGGDSGPALHLTVTGAQLEAFRDDMLRELQPQWDKFAEVRA